MQANNKKNKSKKNKPQRLNSTQPRQPTNNAASTFRGYNDPMVPRRMSGFKSQARSIMSKDGSDWLVAALDPFHDAKRTVAGYPDMDGSNSVVSASQYQMEIVCPAGLATAWDAHIFTLPQVISKGCRAHSFANNAKGEVTQTALTTATTLSAVNCISAKSGELLFPTTSAWAPVNGEQAQIGPGPTQYGGCSRLVGWGIELINTSPQVNKSGNLICYRQTQRTSQHTIKVSDLTAGNLITGGCSIRRYRRPPSSASEAMLLPGSMSWEAKHGAYAPVTQDGIENPAAGYQYMSVEYGEFSDPDGVAEFATGSTMIGAAAAVSPINYAHKFVPYDTVGFYLTGLDPGSTFVVKTKMYWEKFPSVNDSVLLPLASPSARYDLAALQMYSELVYSMPVGTVSANNASGQWFAALWKKLYEIAGPILKLIPGSSGIVDNVYGTGSGLISAVGQALPFLP